MAAPADSELTRMAAAEPFELVRLPGRGHLHPGVLLTLLRWVRANPGAILHSHSSAALLLAAWVRRLAPGCRVVHTRRVGFPVRPSAKYRTSADRYVAISSAVAAELVEAGLDPGRLAVVHSGIDVGGVERCEATSELDPARRGSRVCCVAQMTREKGHDDLLAAWAEVLRTRHDSELVLVGDGPERPRLEPLAAGAGVLFTGFRDDPLAFIKAAAVYTQPSRMEGLGTSVLDAMACGLPVVATRVGGLPELIVPGSSGLLVPPEEPAALAAAIGTLLDHPGRAAAMGLAGRRLVHAHFTVDHMVRGYLAVYRSLRAY